MATKSITDLGSNRARYFIERDPNQNRCRVVIPTSDGDEESVTLEQAAITSALTAQERNQLANALDKLYAAAIAVRGFQ